MRTIGIRELKAQRSKILRDIQAGDTCLVTDRGGVAAEVRPRTVHSGRCRRSSARWPDWQRPVSCGLPSRIPIPITRRPSRLQLALRAD